jgi:hypothetical protein
MCSSPKPKARAKGKKGSGGGVLSNMSAQERSRFSERANVAQERRHQLKIKQKQQKLHHQERVNRVDSRLVKSQNVSFGHWFLNASLKDIFNVLVLGKPKSI